jgi:arylsulfatase A-like enzyme
MDCHGVDLRAIPKLPSRRKAGDMSTREKPNILIFMTDQQRGDTVLAHHPCKTPHLDQFREQGVTFTETFCPSPHCCPSRATFFTGLYPSEHGIWNNVGVANALTRGLRTGARLWSQDLAAAGYQLTFGGKWHVSSRSAPSDHGWSELGTTGALHKEWEDQDYIDSRWEAIRTAGPQSSLEDRKPGEILRPGYPPYHHYGINEDPFSDRRVVDEAVRAIRERGQTDTPWCQFVGTLGPHDPYHVPQRFLDLYKDQEIPLPASFEDTMEDKPGFYRRTRAFFDQLTPEEHRDAIRHYWAFCSYEDHLFGRVLEALEDTGDLENTMVIYLSDHGDYTAEHGLWCKGLPCFRGAYHVPAIVRWPAGISGPGRSEDLFVSLADFGPTILEAADVQTASGMSGASLLPILEGRRPSGWRQAVHTQTNGNELYGIQRSVTTRDWKYVFNGFDFDELYDLRSDPEETINLADREDYLPKVHELCEQMWRFVRERGDACINPYIMTGFGPVGPGVVFRDS